MSTAATIRKLWKTLLCVANVAALTLLWLTCLSTWLEPSLHPRLAQIGLLFPVFLCLNLAFIVIWLITSWEWVALPVFGMLLCIGNILDYYPINLWEKIPDGSITVLSYNTGDLATNQELMYDGLQTALHIESCGADIICLQECPIGGGVGKEMVDKMDSLGYRMRQHGGQVIFARWDFLDQAVLESQGGGNGFMVWRISNGTDTLLLVNAHLQSNHFNPDEKSEYKTAIREADGRLLKSSGRQLLSKLTGSARLREMQVDSLCALFDQHKGEKILLCGDLNDTPVSYTYRQVSKRLVNTYRQSGSGVGISLNQKGFPVRIDHIFISDNIESHQTFVDHSVLSSDHYPIVSHISILPKTEE